MPLKEQIREIQKPELEEIISPRRFFLFGELNTLIGDGAAGFYLDACRIIEKKINLQSAANVLGHLAREIQSSVCDVLVGFDTNNKNDEDGKNENVPANINLLDLTEKERDYLESVLVKLDISFKNEESSVKENVPTVIKLLDLTEKDRELLESVVVKFDISFKKKKDGNKKKIRAVIDFLELTESEKERLEKKWTTLNFDKYAHRSGLRSSHSRYNSILIDFTTFEEILEFVLQSWRRKFLISIDRVDKVLASSPSKSACSSVFGNTPMNYKVRKHFFDNIGLEWLQSLKAQKAFLNPPLPSVTNQEGNLSHPKWPAMEYLVRMCDSDPNAIYDIISQIPHTDNLSIHAHFFEIATKLAPEKAVKIALREIMWLSQCTTEVFYPLPKIVYKLILFLAQIEERETALLLFKALFESKSNSKEFVPKINESEYKRMMLHFVLSPEGKSIGIALPQLLKDLLTVAISVDSESSGSGSSWRKAIEDSTQNRYSLGKFKSVILEALRNSCENLMGEFGEKVLHLMSTDKSIITQRLSLHLRRLNPNVDLEGSNIIACDPSYFDEWETHHEYFLFLKTLFPILKLETQKAYFNLIEDGLNTAKWIDFRGKTKGVQPKSEDDRKSLRYWRYTKLLPISSHLNGSWLEEFSRCEKEFGVRQNADFLSYMGKGWTGPTAPITEEDLQKLTLDDLVQLLNSWQPSMKHMSPSSLGLSRLLTSALLENPLKFLQGAKHLFYSIPSVYIIGILRGFKQLLDTSYILDWKVVISLCSHAINQYKPTRVQNADDSSDYELMSVKKEVADLIMKGLGSKDCCIPADLRESIWEIISLLLSDNDPNESYRTSTCNVETASGKAINSVRGCALETAIHYGLWLYDCKEIKQVTSLEDMPELRSALDHHLDLRCERSLAVRSLYGKRFPWLVFLSESWAAKNVSRIFPVNPTKKNLFDVTWFAYISYAQVHKTSFQLLISQYRFSLENLKDSEKSSTSEDTNNCLAEHILISYMNEYGDDVILNKLINVLFSLGSDRLIGHSIEFCARVMRNPDSILTSKLITRMKDLCETRMQLIMSSGNYTIFENELAAYETWFDIEAFGGQWSIRQLHESYKMRTIIRIDTFVMQHLAKLVPKFPVLTMSVLSLLVEKSEWGFHGDSEQLRSIIMVGMSSELSRKKAMDVVNQLGSIGNTEFRDLLMITPRRKGINKICELE